MCWRSSASTRCKNASTVKRGHHQQGARFGHTKIQGKSLLVRGLNALVAVVSTPLSAPVVAATRLRGGNAASARGAASLTTQAIGTARDCGCTGMIVVRLDSAFYNAAVTGAIRRHGARFSVTVPLNASIRAAIAAIPEESWTPIRYPRAIWDDQAGAWISDAEVAEAQYTAFASNKGQAVTARLVVRRVRDLNKKERDGQDELFPVWRYHAVLTDSPFELVQPRGGTVTMPSWSRSSPTSPAAPLLICHMLKSWQVNCGWVIAANIAADLAAWTRLLGHRDEADLRDVDPDTLRYRVWHLPARLAHHARQRTLAISRDWPWKDAFLTCWQRLCALPAST